MCTTPGIHVITPHFPCHLFFSVLVLTILYIITTMHYPYSFISLCFYFSCYENLRKDGCFPDVMFILNP